MKNLLIEYPVLINYSLILSYKHKIVAETSHIPWEYVNISALNTDLFEDFLNKKKFQHISKRFLLFFLHKILFFEKVLKRIIFNIAENNIITVEAAMHLKCETI